MSQQGLNLGLAAKQQCPQNDNTQRYQPKGIVMPLGCYASVGVWHKTQKTPIEAAMLELKPRRPHSDKTQTHQSNGKVPAKIKPRCTNHVTQVPTMIKLRHN